MTEILPLQNFEIKNSRNVKLNLCIYLTRRKKLFSDWENVCRLWSSIFLLCSFLCEQTNLKRNSSKVFLPEEDKFGRRSFHFGFQVVFTFRVSSFDKTFGPHIFSRRKGNWNDFILFKLRTVPYLRIRYANFVWTLIKISIQPFGIEESAFF